MESDTFWNSCRKREMAIDCLSREWYVKKRKRLHKLFCGREIQERGSRMKRVTIRDVADLAGVSRSTVSRVMNGHPAISDETRQMVLAACETLHYVPDVMARALAGQGTHTIGIIVPDSSNPYFSALCTAAEACAAEYGYRVILTNTLHDPEDERDAVERMIAQRVDGMLISACSPASQEEHGSLPGGIPCIYWGNNHGPQCSFVEADNERGAYEAAQYLVCLGHRRICFLGGRQGSRTLALRLEGYRRSMAQNGLRPWEIVCQEPGGNLRDWCGAQASALFQSGVVPDAFLAYSDTIAVRIIEAAETAGLSAPKDFSIIGFDNILFSRLPQIGLTSVSQKKFEAGRTAVTRLLEKINGRQGETSDLLKPELIVRSTCRKRKAKER